MCIRDRNRAESPSYGLTSSYPSGFKANVAGRRVDGLPPAGPINVIESIDVLQHEANHSYLNDKSIRNVDGSPYEAPPSSDPNMQDPEGTGSYQTSDDYEWSQGVTSGLNGMRDITGRKLNTPFEVHKLLDEVEANPAILDNLGDENARIFRSYLKIKEENPKSAERMRNSIVRDSKYLVKNDSSDYLKSLRNV